MAMEWEGWEGRLSLEWVGVFGEPEALSVELYATRWGKCGVVHFKAKIARDDVGRFLEIEAEEGRLRFDAGGEARFEATMLPEVAPLLSEFLRLEKGPGTTFVVPVFVKYFVIGEEGEQ